VKVLRDVPLNERQRLVLNRLILELAAWA